MKIVHISTEFTPIAKVGGLADVVYGLSKKQHDLGHSVEVVLPKYSFIQHPFDYEKSKTFSFHIWNQKYTLIAHVLYVNDIKLTLLECSHPKKYFQQDSPYSNDDSHEISNFLFFSRAAIEYLNHFNQDCFIHVHDWPTAIIPLIIKKQYHQLNTRITGSLLTIHNLQFQGHCSWHHLNAIGFDPTPDMNMNDPRDNHRYNLLKSGILYADHFTTVSPTYAKEIQTHDHGWWLQDIIKEHSYKLSGILNGIDVDLWNPSTDTALERNYSAQAPIIEVMQAKHHNKRHLQQQVGLPHSNRPLIISITRLASQKAPHLILQAMKKAISFDMQYLLIGGITSEPFTHLFDEVKHHPNIHIEYGFNDELARLSYAGADAIMIPSYFEPCGLTQLIGMRYGTIPIVRRTGGLNDTVIDNETGFIFNDPNEFAIDYIMTRVDACFGKTPEHWQKMMYRGMHIDVSWEKPAREYLELYQKIAH